MNEHTFKSKSEVFRELEKHRYMIVRDYEKRIIYRVLKFAFLAIGLLITFLLSINNFNNWSVAAAILTFAFLGFFTYLESFCPVCNNTTPHRRVENKFFESEKLFCEKCNLTDKQMSKYVDMLKRGVEINEENVRRIFLEK